MKFYTLKYLFHVKTSLCENIITCVQGLHDAVNGAPSVGLDAMRGIYLAKDVLRE